MAIFLRLKRRKTERNEMSWKLFKPSNVNFILEIRIIKENAYLCPHQFKYARVAELVDALDSKSSFFRSAGSIPAPGTKASVFTGALSFLVLNLVLN